MTEKVPGSTSKTEVIIDNPASFAEWRKSIRKISVNNKPLNFVFRLNNFSETENQLISRQANTYHGECGCNSGSFFMTFMMFAAITVYFITGGRFNTIGLTDLAKLAGIVLLSAIAGKIFGLIRARWRLIKLAENIKTRLSEPHPDESLITNH